jgi:hypothetical protein
MGCYLLGYSIDTKSETSECHRVPIKYIYVWVGNQGMEARVTSSHHSQWSAGKWASCVYKSGICRLRGPDPKDAQPYLWTHWTMFYSHHQREHFGLLVSKARWGSFITLLSECDHILCIYLHLSFILCEILPFWNFDFFSYYFKTKDSKSLRIINIVSAFLGLC